MITRHLRGTTSQNNAQTLPVGRLTIDSDKKALRLHDGVTPGGYEAVGVRAVPLGPGGQELTAGDSTSGFYGEVPTTELINGTDLAAEIGLSAGSPQNSDVGWLKFNLNGATLFVAKQTLRYDLLWQDINAVSAVDGVEVSIGDFNYKVRLMTGGDGNPSSAAGGEWNALMYPVSEEDPNGQGWGINYTAEDLLGATGNGARTWCVEESSSADFNYPSEKVYVFRGNGPTGTHHYNGLSGLRTTYHHGWRPVLELIP